MKRAVNGQFYWVLTANNHKVILTGSEQHTQKHNCIKSIKASKKCAMEDSFVFFHYYFRQIANNGEQLGKSENYTTRNGAMRGMRSVIKHAPDARIIDTTIDYVKGKCFIQK